jgi:serine phosphatase RsbU (regulator of sigma subunit)
MFNIHNMDERNVGIYMLDVCGHGVPASKNFASRHRPMMM